jgi:hypothetical protein
MHDGIGQKANIFYAVMPLLQGCHRTLTLKFVLFLAENKNQHRHSGVGRNLTPLQKQQIDLIGSRGRCDDRAGAVTEFMKSIP